MERGTRPSRRQRLQRTIRWCLRAAPKAMVIVGPLALVVAFTVRDGWPLVSTFFYATPPVLVAAGAVVGAVLAGSRERRSLTLGNLALAGLAFWAHMGTAHFAHAGDAEPGSIRGVFWNVARGRGLGGWDAVAAEIAAREPDLVLLVEPGYKREGADAALEAALPGYARRRFRRKVLAFVRGSVELERTHSLADHGTAAVLRAEIDGRALAVVVADLTSNPWRWRAAPIERLHEVVTPLRDEPALVVGDFNTPRRSAHLDAWRPDWTHAFEAAGDGFDGTWPAWLPVLSIDQVWASRPVAVTRCELVTTRSSDHRMVVFEVH